MNKINRDIFRLALPSMLANITVPIVGMVDIAVAGHLTVAGSGAATLIGGITIGTMLLDLLYWNFSFLRVSTGGLVAQAYGQQNWKECARVFSRAVGISFAIAFVILSLQWVFIKLAFLAVDCTPEVAVLAKKYFFIRIWAAPATLGLMAFKGWFVGMQDSVSSMVTDLVVNIVNIVLSIVLALGLTVGSWHYDGMGYAGIAVGTVIAQYSGLLAAVLLVLGKYRKKVFADFSFADFKDVFKGGQTRRFFAMNVDLLIRSLCFIGIYIGFTSLSAHYGDLILASCSILMKILMLFSYFTDGFAYAGEALVGRFIGARDAFRMRKSVVWTFVWSMGLAAAFILVYAFGGRLLVEIMTSDEAVIEMVIRYIPWLLAMPLIGCAAFTWDGIFIGATATKDLRNSLVWATVAFFAAFFVGLWILQAFTLSSETFGIVIVHILMAAYFAHLIVRTVYMSARYKSSVLSQLPE